MVYLKHTATIRSELEEYIQREGLNLSQLGRLAGLNAGTVSSLLKGNRVMAVDQLDRMTAVLSLPKGHFYEQYIQECMVDSVPNWRRIKPLLYRCAELNKLDCIQKIVQLLMDNLTYSPLLFEAAEEFFNGDRQSASILLYESVAMSERRQHSERLAFCQYRLFTLKLGDNQEQNYQTALQFEPFIDRLDEIDQLDALRELANAYRSLHLWDKLEKVAEEMGYKANIQLHLRNQMERKEAVSLNRLKRPLFVYSAYSNLLLGSVCDARREYEKALQYNYAYSELDWVKETDKETLHWLNLFREWAKANIFVASLMSGDFSVISDYVTYIEQSKDEWITGLLNITKAANIYDMNIDSILQHFEAEIITIQQQKQTEGVYTQQTVSEQQARLFYEIAHYYLRRGGYPSGFKYLLDGLEKSTLVNNETYILKCVRLLERFREFASNETQLEYQILLREG